MRNRSPPPGFFAMENAKKKAEELTDYRMLDSALARNEPIKG